jgi:hypothetical protein
MPQSVIATDMALVNPVRSASSHNNAVPACETRLRPSVVTS